MIKKKVSQNYLEHLLILPPPPHPRLAGAYCQTKIRNAGLTRVKKSEKPPVLKSDKRHFFELMTIAI
ncbi:MAG: hypothetical protein CRN43_21480 [Candidatus Nephrothrix sp. EaCA]|nr:MAG: hypothetical protein CRN43_21480 [Candidatus Nephrothrix sp. EaCA]